MKCPACGAETQGKFCEYCGSEMPKDNTAVYIANNYYGATTQENAENDNTVGKCPKCGHSKITFKREHLGTATRSTSRKNVIGRGRTGQSVSQSSYRTIGVCQNCGYTWNPNANISTAKSGRKTWLWVLGWILIFPIPLTILLIRKKDMKPAIKYGIIALAWILFLVIALSANNDNDTTQIDTSPNARSVTNDQTADKSSSLFGGENALYSETGTLETTEKTNPYAKQEANIRRFVDEFNAISDTPVTEIDFRNNHTIAYLVIDGFSSLSIKVNDHDEMGFIFIFEFSDGTSLLGKYEELMSDIVKVFDDSVEIGDKFQEANDNMDSYIHLNDSISVEYHYLQDAVGFKAADTYTISLISSDYNKP